MPKTVNQNWCSWSPSILFKRRVPFYLAVSSMPTINSFGLLQNEQEQVWTNTQCSQKTTLAEAHFCSRKQMWTPWKVPIQCEGHNVGWKNPRQQKQSSATSLTSPSLICCSVFRPQSKQMTWAAWGTGVPNSHLVSLKEEMWWIFICGNCLKC